MFIALCTDVERPCHPSPPERRFGEVVIQQVETMMRDIRDKTCTPSSTLQLASNSGRPLSIAMGSLVSIAMRREAGVSTCLY